MGGARQAGIGPGYQQLEIDDELRRGALVTVASGLARHRADTAIRIANRHAALHVARLAAGESIELPEAPYLHLFVARGGVTFAEVGALTDGDAVRLTGAAGQRLTATEPTEVLVWEMHAALAGW